MSYNAIEKKLESGEGRDIVESYKDDVRQFMSMFKLSPEEFDKLYPRLKKAAKTLLRKRLSANTERERKIGGGRPFGMCLYAMLAMCLLLYNGVSQDMASAIFHTNRNAARTAYMVVSEALYACLPIPKRVSLSIARASSQLTLLKWMPGQEAIVDATVHRTTNAPRKATRRRQYGRKGGPQRKGQVIVSRADIILHATHSVGSRMHDSRLSAREFPAHIYDKVKHLHRDLGYIGVDHGGAEISEPIKAARGRKLTDEEREFNKARAAERSPAERKQGHLKQYGILDRAPWDASEQFDRDVQIVCGILNMLTIWRSKTPVNKRRNVDEKRRRRTARDLAPLLREWS